MSQQLIKKVLEAVRASIDSVESSPNEAPHDRALRRVLAHLWSAHDELELISHVRKKSLPSTLVAVGQPER